MEQLIKLCVCVCVCVCVFLCVLNEMTVDLGVRHADSTFLLTLRRWSTKVKITGETSRSKNEKVYFQLY